MNVGDLAKDLELSPSAVLDQCQRLGIDAGWVGADLRPAQVALLRAELAVDDDQWSLEPASSATSGPKHARAPDQRVGPDGRAVPEQRARPEQGAGPVPASPSGSASLPPTAVGSMPHLADELGVPDSATHGGQHFAGDEIGDRDQLGRPSTEVEAGHPPAGPRRDRRLDPGVKTAAILAVLAALVAFGANMLHDAAAILGAWVVLAVLLISLVVSANRARYRITTHPEHRSGLVPAAMLLVVGLLASLALGGAVWTVVRSAPADQAPLELGSFNSVQRMRWGYTRVTAIADSGWERPAKDAGTCWTATEADREARRPERVEVGGQSIACSGAHRHEVLGVFAYGRDADAPYPGIGSLTERAMERCQPIRADLVDLPAEMTIEVEYPTAQGWADGDHDVACVATAQRSKPLLP